MADPNTDLSLPRQEAGALFRAEMLATQILLGYWRHIAVAVGVVLVAVLVYGQYKSSVRTSQRGMTAQIATAWADIPPAAVPGQLTSSQETEIRAIALQLSTLGESFKGPAAAEAYLKSAELYRVLGDTEEQRKALEGAVPFARGPLLFAARGGIANLDVEAGNTDAAAATWRELMDTLDGYLAEEAALSLGQIYSHAGRDADARSVYVEFQTRWPASPRLAEVADRLGRLDAAAPELAPELAPGLAPAPLEPLAPEPAPPVAPE